MSDKVFAPFTDEQVASINAYQAYDICCPFCCADRDCLAVLQATPGGMVCPRCGSRREWVYWFMADWTWSYPASRPERA